MKLKSVLLGLTAAAMSAGVAFAQMQPIPNPPEAPKASMTAKHHAKAHHANHHGKKKSSAATSSTSTAAGSSKAPASNTAQPSGAK